jgi:hypothetical protein
MRGATLVAALAIVALAGCAGDSPEAPQTFTAADVQRIANVQPATTGWEWPTEPSVSDPYADEDEDPQTPATDPLVAELVEALDDLDFVGDAGNKWQDDEKLANLAVELWRTEDDAHSAMEPLRAFAVGFAEQGGEVTMDQDVDGLGDEAWKVGAAANGVQVTYKWRRGPLVLEAHVHCFGVCPPDVDALAREWVDAIDEEARAGG